MGESNSSMNGERLIIKNKDSAEYLFRCIWKEDIHPNWRPIKKENLGPSF